MIKILGKHDKSIDNDIIRVYNEISKILSLPENIAVNLTFVGEKKIKELNKTTRNIDKVTDVLSYPYTELKVGEKLNLNDYKLYIDQETNILEFGDIYICTKRAEEQAKEYKHSYKREISFLALHGFLHLLGYDHINEEDEILMKNTAENILNFAGIRRKK